MKTSLLPTMVMMASLAGSFATAHDALAAQADSYIVAQATGGAASSNTTTGSTATSDTDPRKGSTTPDSNQNSKPPQQK